mgnify:CR=1 FL=1
MTIALSPVLVANRGEIAVRVIRTLREMGLDSVAVYAEADRDTLACELATSAYSLGGKSAAETYLNPEAILEAAAKSGARAIHPGYGFLSENADFASRVAEAGLVWIGPSAEAIESLGDKIRARELADSCKVPTITGRSLEGSSVEDALELAQSIGYPVLIKRADGGGGRGISRMNSDSDIRDFYTNLSDPSTLTLCFMEKFISHGRHVETQCARDSFGTFAVVSTRDCSVQRRNQKVVEEAPAPFISEELNTKGMLVTRCWENLHHIPTYAKSSPLEINVITLKLNIDQFIKQFITRNFKSWAQTYYTISIFLRRTQAINTRYRRYNDDIVTLQER